MHEGTRLFSSFSFWLDKGTPTLHCGNKRLLALNGASCEGFQHQETWCHLTAKAEVAHNLLDGMNHLAAFFQLHKPRLSCVHSHSTTMGSCKLPKKPEADSLGGEGGFKSLVCVPAGRGEQQMVHNMSSLLKWVTVIVLVLWHGSLCDSFTGNRHCWIVHGYYTFCSGLHRMCNPSSSRKSTCNWFTRPFQ